MEFTYSLENLQDIGQQIIKFFPNNKIFAFHGEMGAGKTTLIRTICDLLNVKEKVSSPTFSIINEYSSDIYKTIYHIDLYRLKTAEEAVAAGVEDCIISGNICLVEWPERGGNLLDEAIHCFIKTISANERKIVINL